MLYQWNTPQALLPSDRGVLQGRVCWSSELKQCACECVHLSLSASTSACSSKRSTLVASLVWAP